MTSMVATKPYQELAAAVILQAIRDFQSRREDPGEEKTAREEARDFLIGEGDFSNQRHIWCHWLGIRPEALSDLVDDWEDDTDPVSKRACAKREVAMGQFN